MEKEKTPPRPLTNQDFVKFIILFSIGLLCLYGFVSGYKALNMTSGDVVEICDGESFCEFGITSMGIFSIVGLIAGLFLIGMSLPWDNKPKSEVKK